MVGDASRSSSSPDRSAPSGKRGAERGRGIVGVQRGEVGGCGDGAVVDRTVAQAGDGHVGNGQRVGRQHGRCVAPRCGRIGARDAHRVEQPVVHAEATGVGDAPDDRRPDLPAPAQLEHRLEVLRRDDGEHALLALRRHHLDAVHPRLPLGHAGEVDVHPRTGLGRGLRRRARDAGGAEVLHPDREPGVEELEARLDEALLLVGIADLHRRPLRLVTLGEAGGGEHARPADAVAPGGRPQQHRDVADALGLGEHQPLHRQHTEAEHIDERVVAVAVVEHDLAAHRRHADRVAVAADAGDHAFDEIAGAGVVERTEPQRVHERDRTRAHREDVADDAADARGRALVGLDRGGMVVALDADGDREPVTDVDDAGALARTDQHPWCLGGKPTEVALGRLVGAVLRPHHRVHRELELGGLAVQQLDDGAELVVGESELPMQGFAHGSSAS